MFGLGSSSQLGIGIAISLHNQFSREAQQINSQLLQMRKNSTSALAAAVTDYRNRAAGIAVASGAMAMGMYRLAEDGAKFQHTINQVAIVGGRELGRTRDQLTAFANQMSKTFTNTPQEVAETMFENIKAGVSTGLEEITKYQVAAAQAADESLSGPEGVANRLLGIMNAMQLKAGDIYEISGQKMSQFARVANAVTAVANASMTSVNQIGEAMEYFAGTASLSKVPLEDAIALVGKLSQLNIHGSSAGTALNNMTQQMINVAGPMATKKKLKALAMMGVDPRVLRSLINGGNAVGALQYVDEHARRLPTTERLSLLNQLFNMRGGRGIMAAFLGGDKSISSLRQSAFQGEAGDIALKQAKAMANDLYGDMKLLHNAFLRFKAVFAEALGPTFRVALSSLTHALSIVGRILNTPIGRVFAAVAGASVALVGVLFGFRAALLTATIALRGFGAVGVGGGFGGLFRGSLGMIGSSRLGGYGNMIRQNANGRWMVQAGQTVTHGGTLYKGGQMLPSSFLTGLGLASSGSAAAGIGSKLGGFLGKAAPFIGRAMGFMGELLPVVGWVITGVTVLQALYGFFKKKDVPTQKLDPLFLNYYRNLDTSIYNSSMSDSWYNKMGKSRNEAEKGGMNLFQTLNVNMDGFNALTQNIQKTIANQQMSQMESQFNFELPD